jgi:prefoldin subunit 5
MDTQQKIDQIKTALAAIDNAIAQTQSALQSPSTSADDVRALRATLIDLQTQRSQLNTELINLQASQQVVADVNASTAVEANVLPRKLSIAKTKDLKSIKATLDASILDRGVIQAT